MIWKLPFQTSTTRVDSEERLDIQEEETRYTGGHGPGS